MRAEFLESLAQLLEMGFSVAATPGTASYYSNHNITNLTILRKPTDEIGVDGQPLSEIYENASGEVLEWIREGKIDLVINIPEGTTRKDEVTSGYLMRRTAVDFGISLLTNTK